MGDGRSGPSFKQLALAAQRRAVPASHRGHAIQSLHPSLLLRGSHLLSAAGRAVAHAPFIVVHSSTPRMLGSGTRKLKPMSLAVSDQHQSRLQPLCSYTAWSPEGQLGPNRRCTLLPQPLPSWQYLSPQSWTHTGCFCRSPRDRKQNQMGVRMEGGPQ